MMRRHRQKQLRLRQSLCSAGKRLAVLSRVQGMGLALLIRLEQTRVSQPENDAKTNHVTEAGGRKQGRPAHAAKEFGVGQGGAYAGVTHGRFPERDRTDVT